MADLEPKWLWRLKLAYWMLRMGYTRDPLWAWRLTGQRCWLDYYDDGFSAHAAIYEDASYD